MIGKEKERLNQQVQRKYWLLRLATGAKTVIKDWKKGLLLAVYLLSIFLLWYFKPLLFPVKDSNLFSVLNNALIQLIIPFYAVGGLFFLLIKLGTPWGSKATRDNLLRIGLVNHAGEAPLLLAKHKNKKDMRITIMEFVTNGIPLIEWQDKKNKIESALNILIVKIVEGKNKRHILLYSVSATNALPERVYWKDDYLSQENFTLVLGEGLTGKEKVNLAVTPHILLGGSTGSGKSVLLKSLIMQCINKGAVVSIADFKGGVDFPSVWHRHCRIVIEENGLLELLTGIVDELMRRRDVFKEFECANIDEYNAKIDFPLSRLIFACDEVAEILDKTGVSKEQKDLISAIENKLSTIARLGRAFGIHLILSTQRPDANILSGQIKNNVNFRVCGRADNVLSMIIIDSTSANDQIAKDAQGRFITHDGVVFQGYLFDENGAFDMEGSRWKT